MKKPLLRMGLQSYVLDDCGYTYACKNGEIIPSDTIAQIDRMIKHWVIDEPLPYLYNMVEKMLNLWYNKISNFKVRNMLAYKYISKQNFRLGDKSKPIIQHENIAICCSRIPIRFIRLVRRMSCLKISAIGLLRLRWSAGKFNAVKTQSCFFSVVYKQYWNNIWFMVKL